MLVPPERLNRWTEFVIAKLAQAISFIGLTILIVATPWAFGGNVAKYQVWLFIVACCTLLPALLLLAINRWHDSAVRIPMVGYVLLTALAAGLFQVAPLPISVLKTITPNALEMREVSAASVHETLPEKLPISLFANSTLSDLSLLVLVTAVFIISSIAIRNRVAQIALLGIVAANGAAFALFGLIQQLTFNGMLYWSVPLRFGGKPFAAFVNRNHAGGYLNMCIAAALALTYYALSRHQIDYDTGPDDFAQPYAQGGALNGGFTSFLANLDGVGLLAIALAGCATIGTTCSASRGALLALFCAATFTAIASARARGGISLAVGGVAVLVICIGLAMWLGSTDVLAERWGDTVNQLEGRSNSRVDHWQDVVRVCRDYWFTGTGLGTYRFAYRPYETQLGRGWFMHAENQYLEAFVEMGWLGLSLIGLAISFVLAGALRLMRTRGDSLGFGVGLAGVFMITSQAVHAGFDFGLYMPANAILCAAISGMAVAKIPFRTGAETQWSVQPSHIRRVLESALLLVVCACLVWATLRATKNAKVAIAFESVYELDIDSSHELEKIDASIAQFQSAIRGLPGDAEARFRLAELHTQRYRELAVAELKRSTNTDDQLLWEFTLPLALHNGAHKLKSISEQRLDNLRSQPLIQQELVPAVEQLLEARKSCPLLHKVHFRIAELFVANPSADAEFDEVDLVQTAVRLGPGNPDILLRAGLLDWQAGRKATARAEWRKSLTLSSVHAEKIFEFVANQDVDVETTISEVTPAEPEKIVEVARQLRTINFRVLLADKAEEALSLAAATPGNRSHLLASIFELRGQVEDSIGAYKTACEENPDRLMWRYDLAKLLQKSGRLDEAAREAAECVRRDPGSPVFRQLLKSIRSAAQAKN